MPKKAPTRKDLIKLMPRLGMGEEPFDMNQDLIVDSLFGYTTAIWEHDKKGETKELKKLLQTIDTVADDNVAKTQVMSIRKTVMKLGKLVAKDAAKYNQVDPAAAAALGEDDGASSTSTKTIMSKMDARQQKQHMSNALTEIAEKKANDDTKGVRDGLRFLAYEVQGSDLYNKYDYAALEKLADDILNNKASGQQDAPQMNLEMVKKTKWPVFFKTYGVVFDKKLQPTFDTLAKILVKEGPSSGKPLKSAKDAFAVMKADSTAGKFKSPQHLLGAVTDALLKNGGAVKVISESQAKELIAR